MMCVNVLFSFILFLSFYAVTIDGRKKLSLSVYYSSNCPKSKEFILNQVRPALKLLNHHISLKLVPFGLSKSINEGQNGFHCQHGQTECLANMIQDCVLYEMRKSSDMKKLQYVSCEMETGSASKSELSCVENAGVLRYLVEQCINYGMGIQYQLLSEFLTKQAAPKTFPAISIDGVSDEKIPDSFLHDLNGVLCSFLHPSLRECEHYYNGLALNYILDVK